MNMIFTTCFSVLFIVHSAVLQYRSVEAYYWRDFNGLIPSDAIKGGKDENGKDTYVAQFNHPAIPSEKSKLHTLPGFVKKGSRTVTAGYGTLTYHSSSSTNPKILCGIEYEYKWFSPNDSFPPNCRFVIGGNENSYPMHVGRGHHNNQVIVGKIFPEDSPHTQGLIIATDDGSEMVLTEFEVLTHCP